MRYCDLHPRVRPRMLGVYTSRTLERVLLHGSSSPMGGGCMGEYLDTKRNNDSDMLVQSAAGSVVVSKDGIGTISHHARVSRSFASQCIHLKLPPRYFRIPKLLPTQSLSVAVISGSAPSAICRSN